MGTAVMISFPQFNWLKPQQHNFLLAGSFGRSRCDFVGSPTKLITVASTRLMLFGSRLGLAPSANRKATAGLKLEARDSGLQTRDPDGCTLADALACGAVGHIIGVGVVLDFNNIGAL
ncbi:hypothetical protein Pfo_023523 [Paulownia fortunei]|nr:hypothetical protein Pfo_023523 [Paulownia fortunei]